MQERGWFCADNIIFASMQGLFWSGVGLLLVFITSYFESRGYSSVYIGIARAAGAVGASLGSFCWGAIADRSRRIGTVALIIAICGVMVSPLFIIVDGRMLLTLFVFVAASFFLLPLLTLIDSWTTQMEHLNPAVSYGATRAMGSLGFAIMTMIAGRAFDAFGIELVFPSYAVFLTMLIPVFFLQRRRTQSALALVHSSVAEEPVMPLADAALLTDAPPPDAATVRASAAEQNDAPPTRLLNRQFVTFLIIGAVSIGCFASTIIYIPLLMSSLGGTHRHVGTAFSVLALSEVPFMICSAALLRRFRDTRVIAVAFGFFFLRIVSYALVQTPGSLIAVQVLRGASFAIFLPAAISFCSRIVPYQYRTRAIALLGFLFFGIGDISASLAGGWLIAQFNVRAMYVVLSAISALPIVAYWIVFVPNRPRARG